MSKLKKQRGTVVAFDDLNSLIEKIGSSIDTIVTDPKKSLQLLNESLMILDTVKNG